MVVMLISLLSFSQLTGTKTIPGDYASIAAAISALNTSGVGAGGVTFDVAANYTESFTTLTDGLITTSTSGPASPVVFQKSGTGSNPLITGVTTAASNTDYIICTAGTDYITFDGIDVTEPTGAVEWGYAILKGSATNGSQHVTIRNCSITMNKANLNTIGVYSNNTTASSTSQLVITVAEGTNSFNKIYNNTISNVYSGILLSGYNDITAPYSFYDQNNAVGKDGANTISNFGGSTAAKYGIYTYYQNGLKIANNTISGTVEGTGACSGIQLNAANNANVDILNNTISIQYTGGTTAAFYGIYNNMGTTFINNILNFYDNIVTNCTQPNATSGNAYYLYNYASAQSNNFYGNQVTNNTYGSASAVATGTVAYVYYFGSPATATNIMEIHHNVITGNSRVQSVVGAGTTYYIYPSGGGVTTVSNVYNNLIDNNIAPHTGTIAGIYYLNGSSTTTKSAYNNTITNIQNIRGTFYGIYTGNGAITNIYNNKVQGISSLGTTGTLSGIYLSSSTGNGVMNVYNNMVGELYGPSISSATALYGIYAGASSTTTVRLYHNTVYLSGTSSGANFGSSGLYIGTSPSNVIIMNNIINNNTTPTGTGFAVALRWGSTTYINMSPLNNNNNYYAGTPGPANLIFYDGTNPDQTLELFKTRIWPKESQSVTELCPFVNRNTSPYDLHIDPTIPSQCESAAKIIPPPQAVIADFDNQPRYPENGYPVNPDYQPVASDIGADEFGGIPLNIVGPTIIYTPFMNTASMAPRTLNATIFDVHGVPVTGIGLPRIAWKINYSGSWTYTTGVPAGNDQYSFTFGGGVALGDTVHYYVVAQDNFSTPAAWSYPYIGATGYTTNPPASNPPSTPSKYKVVQGLCGTYTVGAGQTYTTLGAALDDMDDREITCPVTLLLTDNSYSSETYPIIINPIAGTSATNTLTIKPAPGITPEFQTNYPGVSPTYWSQISINGAQWIILDGSNVAGGTDRSMTFRNTAGNGFAAAIGLYNNGTVGAGNIVIKNCVIQAHEDQIYNAQGIVCYSITGNAGYHDLIIDNNAINSAKFAVQITGIASNPVLNAQVTNNSIGSMTAGMGVGQYGVSISYADNILVEGNEIIGIPTGATIGGAPMGVSISSGSTNVKVRKNIIHDIVQLGTAFPSGGALGIYFSSDATSVTEISNNVIYNIKSPGQNLSVTGGNAFGIYASAGGNLKIYHNSIYLGGNYLSSTVSGLSSCMGFGNNLSLLDVRDNILKNSSQPSGGTPSSKSYCITAGTNTTFTTINYNDYFADGIGPNVGYIGGADKTSLVQWQSATGQDVNSISVDPVFTSPTYLFPTSTSMGNAGYYFASLPTDIEGVTRSNPPDMGAYEFATDPLVVTTGSSNITNTTATVLGTINPQFLVVNGFFDWGLTASYGSWVAASPATVVGNTPTAISAALSGLQPNTTYHFRARGIVDPSGLVAYGEDMTFTTMPDPPLVITTEATSITFEGATLNGTVNANGASSTVSFQWGLTDTYGNIVAATPETVTGTTVTPVNAPVSGLVPATTYHFRAVATSMAGTTYGNDMIFTTNGLPATVTTSPATNVGAQSATLNGTVNANFTPTTVTFEWGLTTSYGNTANGTPLIVSGNTVTPVSASLTGLAQGEVYHFRCVGTNSAATVYGQDLMFETDCPAPPAPGVISGPESICRNTHGVIYSISAVPGAIGYFWNVPEGATITAGDNTTSITVDFSLTAVSGNITVAALNLCGAGPTSSLAVTVNALPVPTISGPAITCINSNYTYSTQTGMTDYVWSVTGGTITSGSGTASVMVTWNSTGNKSISVSYTNTFGCGALTPTVLAVFVDNLPVPTITGNTVACANSDLNVYTTQQGFGNYTWTVTSGGVIASGQGTYQIEIDWNNAGNQTVTVNYTNASGCFAATPASLAVSVTATPGAAGAVTGTPEVCAGTQGVSYSVNAIPNATNYFWTVPAGATIVEGENTNSIRVDFAIGAVSGDVSVYATNICGSGAASPDYYVTVNPVPATPVVTILDGFILHSSAPEGNQWYFNGEMIDGATGQDYQAEEEGTYWTVVTLNGCSSEESNHEDIIFTGMGEVNGTGFTIYPIPNNGRFTVTMTVPGPETFSIRVFSQSGACVFEMKEFNADGKTEQTIDLNNPSEGIYTVVLQSRTQSITKKIVVSK